MAHTRKSPSKASRFLVCAGSLAMEESVPPELRSKSGPAAQLGTATHFLIEKCLKDNSEAEAFKGRIIELLGTEEDGSMLRPGARAPKANSGRTWFEVDSDMIDNANVMTGYVWGRCKELAVPREKLQLETRTNPYPSRDDTSGTADVTIDAWPDVLEVVDYKNGYLTVEHVDNKQTKTYLLGKAIETDFSHSGYRVTIVQPNAPHEEGKTRSIDMTPEELLAFKLEYEKGIKKTDQAEALLPINSDGSAKPSKKWLSNWLVAGDHCTWCDAAPKCPARLALAQEQAGADFADPPQEFAEPKSEEEVARILSWAPMMESLIRSANEFAQRALEAGYAVPGHKLVRGRSHRKFRDDLDESELVAEIVQQKYIAKKELLYTKPELISGPAAEKLVPAKKRKKFNEEFLVKPEGKLTVAPENDPRPAVECSAADDFEGFEEESL